MVSLISEAQNKNHEAHRYRNGLVIPRRWGLGGVVEVDERGSRSVNFQLQNE